MMPITTTTMTLPILPPPRPCPYLPVLLQHLSVELVCWQLLRSRLNPPLYIRSTRKAPPPLVGVWRDCPIRRQSNMYRSRPPGEAWGHGPLPWQQIRYRRGGIEAGPLVPVITNARRAPCSMLLDWQELMVSVLCAMLLWEKRIIFLSRPTLILYCKLRIFHYYIQEFNISYDIFRVK